MNRKTTNAEYKNFLEFKIQDRKNKIFNSLEKEFLTYLSTSKILKHEFVDSEGKNFTEFFTRILKNVFFSSLYKKLNKAYLAKINSFQKKSYESLINKNFKKVVLISDDKVSKSDKGINDFVNLVTKEWQSDLIFRSLPQHDKNWFVTNVLTEINKDLFEKSITNVVKKYPKNLLSEKYSDLKQVSENEINKMWNNFVDKKVWYSYERYVKAFEMLGDREIDSKLEDIYNLIDNETLLIIYNNNENENTFFDYLFNFENELFNYINDRKNLSIVVVSKNNTYKNTFFGLISLANVESISELVNIENNLDEVEDTIDFSDLDVDLDHVDYSDTIELFSNKKGIKRKKVIASKTKAKRKNVTDPTKTISFNDTTNVTETTGVLDKFWNETGSKKYAKSEFTLENFNSVEKEDDDLINPNAAFAKQTNFLQEELNKQIKEIDSQYNIEKEISKKEYDEPKKEVSTIDFDILDSQSATEHKTKTIELDEFKTVEPVTENNNRVEFKFDDAVIESRKKSIINLVKYRTTFENFISQFNFVKDKYNQFNFNEDNDSNYSNFDLQLRKLNLDGTFDFVSKNSSSLFDILYSQSATKKELLRCYSIYLHILQNLNLVDDLLEENEDINNF
jgi:hypothetical protein